MSLDQRKEKKVLSEALSKEGSEVWKVICGREEHEIVGKGPSVSRTLEKSVLAISSIILC